MLYPRSYLCLHRNPCMHACMFSHYMTNAITCANTSSDSSEIRLSNVHGILQFFTNVFGD